MTARRAWQPPFLRRRPRDATKPAWHENVVKADPAARTLNGRVFASKAEMKFAERLEWRRRAGDILEWSAQPQFDCVVNGKLVCRYRPDFRVVHNDGSIEIVEVKGFPTPEWKLKRKLFEATVLLAQPALRYSVVDSKGRPVE